MQTVGKVSQEIGFLFKAFLAGLESPVYDAQSIMHFFVALK